MKETKGKYNFINIAVILIATFLFISNNIGLNALFEGRDIWKIGLLVLTVCLVHMIKSGRFYLELYGSGIDMSTYIKIYCKVTPVSIIFPYKLGEFFRMYCYGRQLENFLKGIVIVLLDRFMDTIALITMLLLLLIFNGGEMTGFVYVLLIFLILVLLIYFLFPEVYKFWKKYMLRARATERKLHILKMFEILNTIYQEITNVSKGRGIVLYFMSLVAWAVEIGGIVLLNGMFHEKKLSHITIEYLSSAMGLAQSVELKQVVFVGVVVMFGFYILIKFREMMAKEKG